MRAIVYTSRTGFTKRYAELLSEATGVPAWSAKEAAKQVPAHSEIFYMGCLEAGTVKGLDALIERYVIRGVAIVGMNPTGNGDLWTEAKINGGFSDHGARIFYLRGGYAPEKLQGHPRSSLMRHMGRSVEKKIQAKGDCCPRSRTGRWWSCSETAGTMCPGRRWTRSFNGLPKAPTRG